MGSSSSQSAVQPERIERLNEREIQSGDYVLYWMQQSQRAEENHALEYAVEEANKLQQPLLVVFGLTGNYPDANARHFSFLLEGLRETQQTLRARNIPLAVQLGEPVEVAIFHARKASLLVCDRGYLRHQKKWRAEVAARATCPVVQVESDVVVPVGTASSKQEFAARTIRPKINRQLKYFLRPVPAVALKHGALTFDSGLDLSATELILNRLKIDHSVDPVTRFYRGGTSEAKKRLTHFLKAGLSHYAQDRDQPPTESTTRLSMYLHFGQISPLYMALSAARLHDHANDRDMFLEQMIVRRELAINFVEHSPVYDTFQGLPQWAQQTLKNHRSDRREHLYTRRQLENAQTHDAFWNAAMQEAKITGYMHNYMRLYWAKKILEWSRTPESAWQTAIDIMNRYLLDARDPNAYTNVSGTFGLHDRAWGERPIFGKVRYMSTDALARKADMNAYVRKIEALK